MPIKQPLYALDASEIRDLLRSNSITVEDYARSLLSRIEKRDHIVKAWTYLGTLAYFVNR